MPMPPACLKCGVIKKSGKLSCCARDGAWFNKCGDRGDSKFEHTWLEGIRACKRWARSKVSYGQFGQQSKADQQLSSPNGADMSNLGAVTTTAKTFTSFPSPTNPPADALINMRSTTPGSMFTANGAHMTNPEAITTTTTTILSRPAHMLRLTQSITSANVSINNTSNNPSTTALGHTSSLSTRASVASTTAVVPLTAHATIAIDSVSQGITAIYA